MINTGEYRDVWGEALPLWDPVELITWAVVPWPSVKIKPWVVDLTPWPPLEPWPQEQPTTWE